MHYWIFLAILAAIFAWRVLSFYWSVLIQRHLPPGPFPLPVIGNLHLIGQNIHVSMANLAAKYGGLMTIYFGTERAVFVSSAELAREVLVRQSFVFGGRPKHLPFGAMQFSHNGKNIAFRENMDSRWKKQRKIFHAAVKSFGNNLVLLENQVCDVVEDLMVGLEGHLGTPWDIERDVRLCVSNIICALTFGAKYGRDEEEFESIMKAFDVIQQSVAPGNVIDTIPLLRRLPIRRIVNIKNADGLIHSTVTRKYRDHEISLDHNNIRDLTDALLKHYRDGADGDASDDVTLTEEEVKLIISDIFIAGIETSAASILWGIYYLASNPEIQNRVYDEIRRSLEPETPPTFRDRRRLPFLHATVSEVFRRSSVVPLLLPHRAVSDAEVSGHRIPKDTTVLVNIWAIHHDPRIWDDPFTFKPARFIDQNGNYSPPAPHTFFPFSAGKRGCAGEVLGKMVVFVTIARLLYYYRFSLASDGALEANNERPASIVCPKRFEICLERRG